MTGQDTARRLLLDLAQSFPELTAELTRDGERLAITDGSAVVVVEPTTPAATASPIAVYRDVHSGEVYGYITQVPAVAERIRAEIKEMAEHA